jgi:hypothetical protein
MTDPRITRAAASYAAWLDVYDRRPWWRRAAHNVRMNVGYALHLMRTR